MCCKKRLDKVAARVIIRDAKKGKQYRRERRAYVAALGLVIVALLSKTVTATLPAGLLVVFWWPRGRLDWRRDVGPLVPFFVLGAVSGLFTAWAERKLIGAEGAEFEFTLVERGLIAGRVVWFYLGKLVWPANQAFIYPRWEIDQGDGWLYFYPLAAAGLLIGAWLYRNRSRAPLAALLFFGGTLFPVLGFFNVYPFRYSLVADHFQYLASLGIISLLAACLTLGLARWRPGWAKSGLALGLAIAGILGVLTWRQCWQYKDVETLYRETLRRNPTCWLALNNLGNVLIGRGRPEEALEYLQAALRLKPDYPECQNNWGNALQALGRPEEAIEHYQAALRFRPEYASAHNNWGSSLQALDRLPEAIEHYRLAIRIKPEYAEAHNNLCNALHRLGRSREAADHARRALELNPDYAEAHNNLAIALISLGNLPAAIEHCREVARLKPEFAEARLNWGNALGAQGRDAEAVEQYQEALRIDRNYAEAHNNLAHVLNRQGRYEDAAVHGQQALRMRPEYVAANLNFGIASSRLGNYASAIVVFETAARLSPGEPECLRRLAWILATCPDDRFRDGQRALSLAQEAVDRTHQRDAESLEALAAAHAEVGEFADAARVQERANLRMPADSMKEAQDRLQLYRSGRPYRQSL